MTDLDHPLDLAAIRAEVDDVNLERAVGNFAVARHLATILALCDEVEKLRGAARTLGKSLDAELTDILNATNSQDLIGDDGDGDWMLVHERLHALGSNLASARTENARLRAVIAKVEKALDQHPECDQYSPNDVITCGWKRAVADVRFALRRALGKEL